MTKTERNEIIFWSRSERSAGACPLDAAEAADAAGDDGAPYARTEAAARGIAVMLTIPGTFDDYQRCSYDELCSEAQQAIDEAALREFLDKRERKR